MIDERREAQASLYALGALAPEEVVEFEAALRASRELRLLVQELQGTAGAMVAAFPQVAAPPALKARILQTISDREAVGNKRASIDAPREGAWVFWVPWALAACFALLCVLLISLGHSLRQQSVVLRQELDEMQADSLALHEQLARLETQSSLQVTNYQTRIHEIQQQVVKRIEELNRQNSAVTNQLNLQNSDARRQLVQSRDQAERLAREKKALEEAISQMTVPDRDRYNNSRLAVLRPTVDGLAGVIGASLWSANDQRGILVLENLPPLPASQTYQFWLIDPRLAIPISGGVVPRSPSGSLSVQFVPQIRVDNAERFAVSIEPAGGSATPTGKIVLASK